MVILSSSRKRITDLNDTKALQLFLSSNQPKTQIYNTDTGVYTPDWTSNKPLITPELYVAGTSTSILSQAKSVVWTEDSDSYPISSGSEYTLGTGNQTLTINRNILTENYLKFDGSQWIDFGNKNASNAITFETWVIPSATGMNEFFSKELNYKFRITNGGTFGALAGTSGAAWIAQPTWSYTITPYTLYHIVGTVDLIGGTINLYVNGTSLGQQTFTGSATPTLNGNPINFGSFNNTGTEAFKGKFLTGRIYNRVLTPTEVTNNYNGTITASGLVAQYLLTEMAGTTVGDSIGTATGTIHGTARWNDPKKVINCTVTYTDPDTSIDIVTQGSIDFEKVQTGQKGPQGPASIVGFLNNETSVVTTANDGTGGTYGAPNTQSTLQILSGTTDVTSQYTISQARNNVTVTEATTSATATVTAMSADTGSVVFTATRTGYPTITKTFSLAKSKMGALAPSPTDYWLNVSSSNITAADNGSYTPSTLTVSAESQVGTNAPGAYSARYIISESTDGNNFTTKYTSAADESSHTYTPNSGLSAIKVDMYQAGGTSVKLDTQVIPVINNGKNSVTVSAWTPQGNVIRNAANTVTAEADLLNGGLPDTGTNYRWVKGNGAATSVIAGAGYEDLDAGKRNYLLNSSFASGLWATRTGTWTVLNAEPDQPNSKIIQTTASGLSSATYISIYSNSFTASAGQTFTFSVDFKVADVTAYDMQYPFIAEFYDSTLTRCQYHDVTAANAGITNLQSGIWYRATYTATVGDSTTLNLSNANTVTQGRIRLCLFKDGTVSYRNVKVEVGSKATPYTLAPEEVTVDPTDSTLYGKNLMKQTSNISTLTPNWSLNIGSAMAATLSTFNDATYGNVIHCNITTNATSGNNWLVIQGTGLTMPNKHFTVGQTYTVSFMYKSAISMYIGFMDSNGLNRVGQSPAFPAAANWTEYHYTFTASITGNVPEFYLAKNDNVNLGDIYLTNVKLEALPYATDYSPAPEDNAANYPNLTSGAGQWVYKNFPVATANGSYLVTYKDLAAITTGGIQTLLADGTNLVQGDGLTNYYGYLKTAVFTSTAKTLNITFTHDDSCSVYVNGLTQYQKTSATAGATAALVLQQGWNHIEFIYNQASGGDGVYGISPTFSSSVDEINANYATDYGSLKGNYGLIGYNTSSMIVNTNAVTDTDLFMAVVTYRGSTYNDTVTIDDVTDPITIIINGARLFKNGQGTNSYTATLWQNGAQIDPSGTQYTYTWYVYNSDGSLDATFGGSGSKTGQTITLASSDINVKGRLQCVVSQ